MTQHMSIDSANADRLGSDAESPKEFLSSVGIEIDPNMESLLQAKLAAAASGQQAAAIIHGDG